MRPAGIQRDRQNKRETAAETMQTCFPLGFTTLEGYFS
jgi:hypothetical protein